MGQPVQFSSLLFKERGRTVIELSSRRIFQEKKAELTKEAPVFLEKVCDVIREDAHLPFAIQPFDADPDLEVQRQKALVKYFSEKLYIPETQIVTAAAQGAEKRGQAIAILTNATPGSSGQ
jgi:hypothetical protein